MASIPHVIISREDEERAMGRCNGKCKSGDLCVFQVDFGLPGGTPIGPFEHCVLCLRHNATRTFDDLLFTASAGDGTVELIGPYCNMEGDYDEDFYIDKQDRNCYRGFIGPFITYNPSHYTVKDSGVVQSGIPAGKYMNWLNALFCTDLTMVRANSRWSITVCANPKCKVDILNFINQSSAEGFAGTVYDMVKSELQCSKCNGKVSVVESDEHGVLVEFKYKWYTKCAFCTTIVMFDKFNTPQTCDYCHNAMVERALESTKVCLRCSTPISMTRRGGGQMITIRDENVYLCRRHRVSGHLTFDTVEDLKLFIM